MIQILLGQDDFSKSLYVSDLAKKQNAQTEFFVVSEDLNKFSFAGEQDLFAKPKLSVLRGLFKELEKKYKTQELNLNTNSNILILEEKIDKRGLFAKKIIADKNVEIVHFNLPHLAEFDKWLIKRVEFYKASISKPALSLLGQKLGRNDYEEIKEGGKVFGFIETFSLWQADSEIKKLVSLANGAEITEQHIQDLVSVEIVTEALEIANSLSNNDRLAVLSLVENFLSKQAVGDVKAGIIQLSALLGEQFRNIAMIQDFVQRKFSDQRILELTSWKSGRLFMVKKAASNFSVQKVKDFMMKLQALDAELKSSTMPPRVLFDLILSQLLSTP